MQENLIIANETIIITLLLVAIGSSLILRHLKLPYTIGLVIIGFAFAEFAIPHITALKTLGPYFPADDIILYIFLPPLIFESAIAVNTRLFSRNSIPILSLAILGVIISGGIIGYMVSWYFMIPLLFALLFGALISSTDPVAVISIFKEIGVPKRLQSLVEGESLLNDAASIIMFQLVLFLIREPVIKSEMSFFDTSLLFTNNLLTSFVGGISIGILGGLILRTILKRTPLQSYIHHTITLVAAYLIYLIGDESGFSGVIAVVACGFVTSHAVSDWLGPDQRNALHEFWEYIGYLANSLIFLLVGITIASLNDLNVLMKGGVLGIAFLISAVLIARLVPVFGIFGVFNIFTRNRVPLSYQTLCFWGGLRGAVAIALVLSIPLSLPFRDLIVAFTITIVLFTIFVQGLTIGPVIRILGLGQTKEIRKFHKLFADLTTSRAANSALTNSPLAGIISQTILDEQKQEYIRNISEIEDNIRKFWDEVHQSPKRMSVIRLFWFEALRFEQKLYRRLYDDGLILSSVYSELQGISTVREERIQSGKYLPDDLIYIERKGIAIKIINAIIKMNADNRISGFLKERRDIHRIFKAIATIMAADGTVKYLEELTSDLCIDNKEISDIFLFYKNRKQESLLYLHDELYIHSQNITKVSHYLAGRTAGSGKITKLRHFLEEGIGDEKILMSLVNQCIREKRKARREVNSVIDDGFL